MATKQNLYIDQGTTFTQSFYLQDPTGLALDLTGYIGRSQLRKEYTDSVYFSFSVDVGANTGVITISLPATVSSNIESGRYLYDVEIESNTSVVTRIVEGFCTITPEVTR